MASFNQFPHVFTPVKIGPVKLKNRLQFSPVVSAHATALDGLVTDSLVAFIGAQARSGVSLITIGSTPVNFDKGRDFYGCLSATRDTDIPELERLSIEAHRYGAKISAELMHAGRIANPGVLAGRPALVPSVVEEMLQDDRRTYAEITESEMLGVVDDFRQAARRLAAAGFDMVTIHGAHGNLVSAFLSPLTNRRTDAYGGSLENRMKFPLMVCEAVREAVGPNVGIEYRISQSEFVEGGTPLEDVIAFLKKAQKHIDVAHLSGGLICNPDKVKYMMPSYPQERCQNAEAAGIARAALDIPVTVVGNVPDMAAADRIIAEGKADVVAMARNIIADMDYVNKNYRGRIDDIRPCLHCTECCRNPGRGVRIRCAVNPTVGRELEFSRASKAETKKKVMVVGGGPAGMMAAQTAAKRGHDVDLYEAADELGGRLREASGMYCKDYFRNYLAWDVAETQRAGVQVHLSARVTPELVAEVNPDVLFVAIGAEPLMPSIPGIDGRNVVSVVDVDRKAVEVGQKVVVCGNGTSAIECAIDLAHDGKEVTVVGGRSDDEVLSDVMNEIKAGLRGLMEDFGVGLVNGSYVFEINDGHVSYRDAEGNVHTLEADTIVTSFGLKVNEEKCDSLKCIVPETYVVGDALQVGNILTANSSAFDAAAWV